MPPLIVYNASAGSGKTFTLAVKYIELLIERPESYRSILAVTFTNKATDEMKQRILSQLYGLAHNLPDSEDYAKKIEEDYRSMGRYIKRKTISENAGKALGYLLHNYTYFRIQTIDAFFQQVMRNMARELNLNANFKLSLNDAQVEEKAVDEMIEELTEKSDLMKWIVDYISDNIKEDKNWNVIGAIKKFGMTIFKEKYKNHEKQLNHLFASPGFFNEFEKQLRTIMAEAEIECENIYTRYTKILESHGTDSSCFKNGTRGACGYFEKYGKGINEIVRVADKHYNKTAQEASTDTGAWIKKADAGSSLETVATALMALLNDAENSRRSLLRNYKSAAITLKHISKLRLLGHIKRKVDETNAAVNRFQLSDTQALLNTMIGNTDAPFVYEKIGSHISHIMIDEFQDTSTAQWKNFKVLLDDCLAQHSQCLIVGDVKQSIYRWRSSDWQLLHNIADEFDKELINKVHLNINYRSETNIINFNNAFFSHAAAIDFQDHLATRPTIKEIYSGESLIQERNPKKKETAPRGHIEITLLPHDDYRQLTLRHTLEKIKTLLDSGVKEKDIAIITRSNAGISETGRYLMAEMPELTLVSDEAFVLEASLAVKTIITAMRLMSNPDDILAHATLARYTLAIKGNNNPAIDILKAVDNLDELLPPRFAKAERVALQTKPVSQLAATIADIFNLKSLKTETAYLCRFFDTLSTFINDSPATLKDILDEWEENMHSTPIESDKVDGIRILTIHKSKGLEFDNVIIPFCDWKMERNDLFWTVPHEQPFSQLPLVPVEFSKAALEDTVYETDYHDEHLQNLVDNMNLLYVAFTRAAKNLFVYGRNPKSKGNRIASSRSLVIPDTLNAIISNNELPGALIDDSGETLTFTYGDMVPAREEKEKHTDNVFLASGGKVTIDDDTTERGKKNISFLQSNKSRDFVSDTDEDTLSPNDAYIRTGTILHRIFSTIETTDDIGKALLSLEQEGELYPEGTSREHLVEMLHKRLESKKVREWFSPGWTLFNECTLLSIDPETGKTISRRPDRVMTNGKETIVIDFKFAAPKPEHRHQVAHYMQLLSEMGYPNVNGYLWYVYTNRVVSLSGEG